MKGGAGWGAPAAMGVASLLDDEHDDAVRRLRDEIGEKSGAGGGTRARVPHLTYHVAGSYRVELAVAALERVAARSRALKIHSAGIGIFPGSPPIIYLPVARGPELAKFHLALWSALAPVADGADDRYHPARWIPHIPLWEGDVELAPKLLIRLENRNSEWEVELQTLCLMRAADGAPEPVSRFEMAGVARNF